MRLSWIALPGGRHTWVWSYHHMLLDGWSMPLVVTAFLRAYAALRRDESPHLIASPPYEDYIAWLERRDRTGEEDFWRRYLAGFKAPTPLPCRTSRALDAGYGDQRRDLSGETTQALRSLARQRRLTLNTLVQGAWALLLHRYSGERDVVFGITVSDARPPCPA